MSQTAQQLADLVTASNELVTTVNDMMDNRDDAVADILQQINIKEAANNPALLPIYPAINTPSQKLAITLNDGEVYVNDNQTWLVHGTKLVSADDYTQEERTLAHEADSTYHLRWSESEGFALNNLSSLNYNDKSLDEDDTAFDSTYSDMLVATVTTDATNQATMTAYKNMAFYSSHNVLTMKSDTSIACSGDQLLFDGVVNNDLAIGYSAVASWDMSFGTNQNATYGVPRVEFDHNSIARYSRYHFGSGGSGYMYINNVSGQRVINVLRGKHIIRCFFRQEHGVTYFNIGLGISPDWSQSESSLNVNMLEAL